MNVNETLIAERTIAKEEKSREQASERRELQRKKCRAMLRSQKQFLLNSLKALEEGSDTKPQVKEPSELDAASRRPLLFGGAKPADQAFRNTDQSFRNTVSAMTVSSLTRSSPTLTRTGHSLAALTASRAGRERSLRRKGNGGARRDSPKERRDSPKEQPHSPIASISPTGSLGPRPILEVPSSPSSSHPASWSSSLRWEYASSYPKRSPNSLRGGIPFA